MKSRFEPAALSRLGAEEFGDAPALICDGSALSYSELHDRSLRLANGLRNLGHDRGERVAVLGDNSIEGLEIFSGLAAGGFIRSTLYSHNSPESNLYLLQLVDASVLLVQRSHFDLIQDQLRRADSLRTVVVFDGEAPAGTLAYDDLIASSKAEELGSPVDDEFQVIRFSAGTTGKPKAIAHLTRQRIEIGYQMSRVLPPLSPEDRYIAAAPLSHATSLPVWPILAAGGAVVLMRKFDPGRLVELIESERGTITFGVPTMVDSLARHPAAATADLSSLKLFIYGGAPMTPAILARGREVFGEVFFQMYGQSEAGVPLTVLGPEDHSAENGRWLGSVGRTVDSAEISIIDDEMNPLPAGEVGEIAVRSPCSMELMWGDPAATAERKLADGTVLTHDMGYFDDHGYLYLTDRKEEMIISGGFNIWPAEIESALADHPAVREVSVFGIPHDKWGETPMAVVVFEDGASATEDELIEWTKERLGTVKRITRVGFSTELPKTPIGKVQRRKVRELHAPASA